MVDPLTPRQREVLDVIQRSLDAKGYPPTLRELAEALDIVGTTAVNYHLERLRVKGWIEREAGVARGLRVLSLCARQHETGRTGPHVGTCRCEE